MLEVDSIVVKPEPSCWYPINFVAVQQMAAEGQPDKMASDMELCTKQRCVTELLHEETVAPNDIHWHLLDISADWTVDVSTERQRVVHFSSGNSSNGPPPLAAVCRLLLFADENAHPIVVTVLKNSTL